MIASIGVRAETDRVILSYRHRLNEEPWHDVEYPVLIENGHPVSSEALELGSSAQPGDAGVGLRSSMAARFLRVAGVINLYIEAKSNAYGNAPC